MTRIHHLRGREQALEEDWSVEDAQWIALVCLHSGVFTRAQYQAFFRAHPERARRFVRRMLAQKMATEGLQPVPWGRPLQVCHITHKRLYRALGVPNIRHRRESAPEVRARRLLSLDYVLEHPDFVWFPTETEKIDAFGGGLGIDRTLFPQRIYHGGGGGVARFFPLKLPIGLIQDQRRIAFVYIDPGHDTDSALRSWGEDHAALWNALRRKGLRVHVVAIGSGTDADKRAGRMCERWTTGRDGEVAPGVAARNPPAHPVRIDTFEVWRSARIFGGEA